MPTFAYSGRTRSGQTVSGERIADSMDGAVAALRREQILVTRINQAKTRAEPAAKKPGKTGKKPAAKSLAVFTRQFSVMIDAGLPLVQCLDILGTQEEDKHFAAVILHTRADVEAGASLADAMRRHPRTFDSLFTNMIAAGEAGGILDTILKRLAVYIEKSVKLTGQVKSAMIYPIAIIVIAGLVVGVILWKVIPTFAQLFAGLGAELPMPTRVVIALSNNLVRFFIPMAGTGGDRRLPVQALLCDGGGAAGGRPDAAPAADSRRHLPEDRGGPVLPDAVDLDQLGRTDSRRAGDHGKDLRQRHRRGRHHDDAQEHRARRDDLGAAPETGVFPAMVTQMINVGEATGALDTMLGEDR